MISHHVGLQTYHDARAFALDLAERIRSRQVQGASDGNPSYPMAIWEAFQLMRGTGRFKTDTSIYDYIGTLISSMRGKRYDSKSVQNVVEVFKKKTAAYQKRCRKK